MRSPARPGVCMCCSSPSLLHGAVVLATIQVLIRWSSLFGCLGHGQFCAGAVGAAPGQGARSQWPDWFACLLWLQCRCKGHSWGLVPNLVCATSHFRASFSRVQRRVFRSAGPSLVLGSGDSKQACLQDRDRDRSHLCCFQYAYAASCQSFHPDLRCCPVSC